MYDFLSKKELELFGIFNQNIFKFYEIKEFKEYLNQKSNNAIQRAIEKYKKLDLIIEKKIGRNKLYKFNFENELGFNYLELINKSIIKNKFIEKSIQNMKNELDKISIFYSLVIFGSYANNTNTSKSDLDIAIFIKDKKDVKKIEQKLETIKLKSLIILDIQIIYKNEFLKMLKTDYENLGKEIAKKNLPILNNRIFYKLLDLEINHGLQL